MSDCCDCNKPTVPDMAKMGGYSADIMPVDSRTEVSDPARMLFWTQVFRNKLSVISGSWSTDLDYEVPGFGEKLICGMTGLHGGQTAAWVTEDPKFGKLGKLYWLSYYYRQDTSKRVYVTVAGDSEDLIRDALATFEKSIPRRKLTDNSRVVLFWTMGDRGTAASIDRKLELPSWKSIRLNYPEAIRGSLDRLITLDPTSIPGRMVLLHGIPGTGKSYAVRAMFREWARWCDSHFITDPENLFGNSKYMLSLVSSAPSEAQEMNDGVYDDDDDDNLPDGEVAKKAAEVVKKDRWQLLVLEDAGEYVSMDARERTGQGLSRMLNILDGILGQGFKTLILITTNEAIEKVHPAITRPGRCLADIEFGAFCGAEADLWRRLHQGKETGKKATVAELYQEITGGIIRSKPDHNPAGFKAPLHAPPEPPVPSPERNGGC